MGSVLSDQRCVQHCIFNLNMVYPDVIVGAVRNTVTSVGDAVFSPDNSPSSSQALLLMVPCDIA